VLESIVPQRWRPVARTVETSQDIVTRKADYNNVPGEKHRRKSAGTILQDDGTSR
jgi:hypothetical protein